MKLIKSNDTIKLLNSDISSTLNRVDSENATINDLNEQENLNRNNLFKSS